jgi:hypothetical protein
MFRIPTLGENHPICAKNNNEIWVVLGETLTRNLGDLESPEMAVHRCACARARSVRHIGSDGRWSVGITLTGGGQCLDR